MCQAEVAATTLLRHAADRRRTRITQAVAAQATPAHGWTCEITHALGPVAKIDLTLDGLTLRLRLRRAESVAETARTRRRPSLQFQSDATGAGQAGDQELPASTVQVSPRDHEVGKRAFRPVDLPTRQVERNSNRFFYAGGYQVLHTGAIQIGPLNLARANVRPVDLAPSHVQGDPTWTDQARDQ